MEKRTLIVTFTVDNFGACLQAYALQKKIQEFGYHAEIINYQCSIEKEQNAGIMQKLMSATFQQIVNAAVFRRRAPMWKECFENFRSQYLKCTPEIYFRDSDFTNLNKNYDVFICGSDMIWAEDFADDWQMMYLTFADKSKCIAYAPSFGKNVISKSRQECCAEYLNEIQCLSCRELEGACLAESLTGRKDIQVVLDPVLLYEKEAWNAILPNDMPLVKGDYVLVYSFGGISHYRKAFFQSLEKKEKTVYIPMTVDEYCNRHAFRQPMGPKEFVNLFRYAKAVVTDTFHGLLFSMVYRKPFLLLERKDNSPWAGHSDRMVSMLEITGLSDRYVDETSSAEYLHEIDYTRAEHELERMRLNSICYLKESLEKTFLNCR